MERSLTPCTVVFDLGGVLVPPEGSLTVVAAKLDVPVERLAPAYWAPRDAYDRGGAPVDFWRAVLAGLSSDAPPPTADATAVDAARLDALDAAHWAAIADDVRQLLGALAEHGTTTAVLSNAPASLAAVVRAADWSSCFSTLLFSSDVGSMKPEPEIYAVLEDRLRRPPHDLVFFDDRPANVDAARDRGWSAHVWNGVAAARRVLLDCGALGG